MPISERFGGWQVFYGSMQVPGPTAMRQLRIRFEESFPASTCSMRWMIKYLLTLIFLPNSFLPNKIQGNLLPFSLQSTAYTSTYPNRSLFREVIDNTAKTFSNLLSS